MVEQVTDTNPGVLEQENENTLIINSVEDLVFLAYDVRNGNTYEGKTIKLGIDLDLNSNKSYVAPLRTDYGQYGYNGELKTLINSGDGFIPIGTMSYLEAEVKNINIFKGIFDGQNKEIINLYINKYVNYSEEEYDEYKYGLFGYNYGVVKNLTVSNCNMNVIKVTGNCNVFTGGIVGQNNGTVENCATSGNITNNFIAGGISGRNIATIEKSYNEAKVSGTGRAGGIAGDSEGSESKCFNSGEITVNGVGEVTANGITMGGEKIEDCFNIGKITVKSNKISFASGIGSNAKIINNCYNLGEVTAIIENATSDSDYATAGGICAYGGTQIKNCYNKGVIIAKADAGVCYGSGIANWCDITNSYNMGDVNTVGTENTKNFAGEISACQENKNINNCNNIGNVKNESGKINENGIGSICGKSGMVSNIVNCSYLATTANNGIGNAEGTTKVEKIEDMPNIIETLGKAFVLDSSKGYPILSWEKE